MAVAAGGPTAAGCRRRARRSTRCASSPREHNLVPLRHTLHRRLRDPGHGLPQAARRPVPAFLLESAEQGQRVGRWSFIGVRPRQRRALVAGRRRRPLRAGRRRGRAPPPGAVPRRCRRSRAARSASSATTSCARSSRSASPTPTALGLPDLALMLTDVLVVFDHLKHTVTILANVYAEDDEIEARLRARARDDRGGRASASPGRCRGSSRAPSRAEPKFDAQHAARGVRGDGRADRRVRPRRRRLPGRPVAALDGAGRRRPVLDLPRAAGRQPVARTCTSSTSRTSRSPAPRPSRCSPSPAATPRRARSPARARAAATPTRTRRSPPSLLADEKERAEHVMLVDLGRNDLGRVCEYGTVEVETFMAVETYSHVMHIVSSVAGHAAARTSGRWTRCARCCPAGTLSGAPKVRAMQIIDELEPVKRGGYGGAVGYLSYTGDLDTCIHIRTVVIKDGVGPRAGRRRHRRRRQARLRVRGVARTRRARVARAIELATQPRGWP